MFELSFSTQKSGTACIYGIETLLGMQWYPAAPVAPPAPCTAPRPAAAAVALSAAEDIHSVDPGTTFDQTQQPPQLATLHTISERDYSEESSRVQLGQMLHMAPSSGNGTT